MTEEEVLYKLGQAKLFAREDCSAGLKEFYYYIKSPRSVVFEVLVNTHEVYVGSRLEKAVEAYNQLV